MLKQQLERAAVLQCQLQLSSLLGKLAAVSCTNPGLMASKHCCCLQFGHRDKHPPDVNGKDLLRNSSCLISPTHVMFYIKRLPISQYLQRATDIYKMVTKTSAKRNHSQKTSCLLVSYYKLSLFKNNISKNITIQDKHCFLKCNKNMFKIQVAV